MTQKAINLGTADQGNGDPLRVAFGKVNDNFTELYTALGLIDNSLNLGAFEFTGSVMTTTDSTAIVIDQATTVTSNLSVGGDVLPSVANGGDLGSNTLPWRSLYVSNNTIYIGGTAVGVDANGALTTGGTVVGSTPAWNSITGKPTFATVATSGAYADLTGKPTIPTDFRGSVFADDSTLMIDAVDNKIYATELTVAVGNFVNVNSNNVDVENINGLSSQINFTVGGNNNLVIENNLVAIQNVSLSVAGDITLGGNIRSEGNINIEINLSDSTLRRWQFGEDGDTVFPTNISINYSGGNVQFPRIIADSGKAFSVQGQGSTGSAAMAWTVDPDAASQYAAVSVSRAGGDNLAKVVLQAQSDSGDAGTAKTWKFNETGTLTLPNGSVIKDTDGYAVAIGDAAGSSNQGSLAVAVGAGAGYTGQGTSAVAIGRDAGGTAQGINAVAIGIQAGYANQAANSIIINATGTTLNQTVANTFTVKPVRQGETADAMYYNSSTGEITYAGAFSFSVAADDSTQRSISSGELIKFIGAGGITTSSDAEGYITITGSGGSVSSLVNGAYTVSLGSDGALTFPGDIKSNGNINIDINLSDSTLRRWSFGEDGFLTLAGPVTLPNGGELRPSTTAYDTALAAWESIRGGEIQFYIDNGSVTPQGWPMYTWHPTGPTAQGYIDFLLSAWTIQQAGGTLIITPAISSAFYQQLRAVLILIRDTYNLNAQGVSISSGYAKSWNFSETGALTIPGDIRSEGNINIDINLSDSTLRRWQFGEDGNLTFPDGTNYSGKDITLPQTLTGTLNKVSWNFSDMAVGNSTTFLEWNLLSTDLSEFLIGTSSAATPFYFSFDGSGQTLGTIDNGGIFGGGKLTFGSTAGNNAGDANAIELKATNGDVYLTSTESVKITVDASDSSARVWLFDPTGNLTFPDGTSQSTAWTGAGSSIPTVVTTGAVGVGGQAHVKVQFTVASATTVTAVGVTVIGVSTPASGQITLSGSPGTGSFDIVAATNVQGETFILMPFATNASGTGYGAPIAGTGTDPCYVKGTMITMADMSRVAVENITYGDNILVWDFDLGEFASAKPLWIKKTQTTVVSCLLTFSDHSELRIVGESPKAHRIFNKEAGKFTYGSMPETPIGTTTFNDQGEEITLISKEWIVGEVEFYNVMTDYHMNLFANSILTSMRYNNLYPITDMKFVKDGRTLRTSDDYPNVEERLYKGFRLAEQTQSVEEIETHIQWLLTLEVERETECV